MKLLTLKALSASMLCLSAISIAIAQPSERQFFVMKTAYNIAREDGHKDPSILQGIVMVETGAGNGKTISPSGSLGVSQVLMSTAKYVLTQFPDFSIKSFPNGFTKEQLAKKLLHDDVFNLQVASKYLLLVQITYQYYGDKLIAAYNKGPNGNLNNPSKLKYVNDVRRFSKSEIALSTRQIEVAQNLGIQSDMNMFTNGEDNVIIEPDD